MNTLILIAMLAAAALAADPCGNSGHCMNRCVQGQFDVAMVDGSPKFVCEFRFNEARDFEIGSCGLQGESESRVGQTKDACKKAGGLMCSIELCKLKAGQSSRFKQECEKIQVGGATLQGNIEYHGLSRDEARAICGGRKPKDFV